jgi:predicted transcriptional regulator
VKTLLSRLVAKRAVAYDEVGNSYLYRAAVDRETLSRGEVESVLGRLLSHSQGAGRGVLSSVLAQFLGGAELDAEEVRKLRRVLDESQKPRKGRR